MIWVKTDALTLRTRVQTIQTSAVSFSTIFYITMVTSVPKHTWSHDYRKVHSCINAVQKDKRVQLLWIFFLTTVCDIIPNNCNLAKKVIIYQNKAKSPHHNMLWLLSAPPFSPANPVGHFIGILWCLPLKLAEFLRDSQHHTTIHLARLQAVVIQPLFSVATSCKKILAVKGVGFGILGWQQEGILMFKVCIYKR